MPLPSIIYEQLEGTKQNLFRDEKIVAHLHLQGVGLLSSRL